MFRVEVGYSTRRPLEHTNTLQEGKYTNRLSPVPLVTETLHSVNALLRESLFIVRKDLMKFHLEPNKCR
jgi:hypothetical protein